MKKTYIILIIIWLVVIFLLSNMSSSDQASKKIVKNILDKTNVVEKNELLPEKENQKGTVFNTIHIYFRKCAHGLEYMVLAILILLLCKEFNLSLLTSLPITTILTSIYSITDEIHQMFVPHRASLFSDCLIDMIGALVGCIIYIILVLIINKSQKKRSLQS